MRSAELGRWLALLCAALFAALPAQADEGLWALLRNGGHALLMRHAVTDPGIGDPPQFRLQDCSTQRNLSAEGRAQAIRVGHLLAERQVAINAVLSSRWCRCLDTARLAFGKVTAEPALDSFFGERSAESASQTAAARARIRSFSGPGNLMMVTHQVNITALTGEYPAMGEILVVRANPDGTIKLVGRIPPPAS